MTKDQFISNRLFKFIGCACYDECPKTKSDDDLYLVELEYFGRYEDDDCNFTYINAKTGKFEYATWTTRFAAPHFSTFLRMPFRDAVAAGYVPKEMLDNYIDTSWRIYKESICESTTRYLTDMAETVQHDYHKMLDIPCTVSTRCRKYKGEGILLYVAKRWNRFNRWAKEPDHYAKVLGMDGRVHTVSAGSVTVDLQAVRNEMLKKVEHLTDTKELFDVFPFCAVEDENLCAIDVDYQAQLQKYNDRKAEQFPGLLQWCKEKAPEKSPRELWEWAEHIYNKKNEHPSMDRVW